MFGKFSLAVLMALVKLKVTGRVQGVFFRHGTCNKARSLALSGYVRNLEDGSVEVEALGPREKLDELIAWCHVGPAGARVDAVEVEAFDPDVDANTPSLFCVRP